MSRIILFLYTIDFVYCFRAIWEETIGGNLTSSNAHIIDPVNITTLDSFSSQFSNATTLNDTVSQELSPEIQRERENLIMIYSILLGSALLLYLTRTYGFFMMCLRISLNLHDTLFRGVTRAKMWFFNTNPSGRLLNRFSRDMHTIDTGMPDSMIDCLSVCTLRFLF